MKQQYCTQCGIYIEEPAFELISKDRKKHLKIYASGKTEGFEEKFHILINRIHLLISQAENKGFLEGEEFAREKYLLGSDQDG